ncbi:MAG: hypothetical protein WC002_10605 [Candidatus Muiribacteriota bacterium]
MENIFNFVIITLLAVNLIFLVVILKNFRKNFSIPKNVSNENPKGENSQIYVHAHLNHLLNVEIEKAERYQFGFTYVLVDFARLFSSQENYHEIKKIVLSVLKRTVRIVDFVIEGEKPGELFILLTETDEQAAKLVIERIVKNFEKSIFNKNIQNIRIASVNYPADATSADLLTEYLYSVIIETDEKRSVRAYGNLFE